LIIELAAEDPVEVAAEVLVDVVDGGIFAVV